MLIKKSAPVTMSKWASDTKMRIAYDLIKYFYPYNLEVSPYFCTFTNEYNIIWMTRNILLVRDFFF